MVSDVLVSAGVAVVVSLVLTRFMIWLAPRLGLIDQPGGRRIHTGQVPRAGGLAIWLTFLVVIGKGLSFRLFPTGGILTWDWLGAFTAGSSVLVIAGYLDDRRGLRPLVKLVAHILAPSIFFLLHPISTGLFPENWHWGFEFLMFIGWSVILINAFNLIDGLDGLCGGLSAVACVALAALAVVNERFDSAILLLTMAGAVVGFLRYNYSPARIFLGDVGSMLMGFFLASAATQSVGRRAVVGAILLPIAVAGVPLLDVLLAIWRRGAKRWVKELKGEVVVGGIFEADADHLHHRLLASGRTQRKVASVLHGIAVVITLLAFLPMVFGKQMIGFSIVGFMIIAIVGLRNLARIEIQHTGDIIHMAIKVPRRWRWLASLLFAYDVVVLFSSGLVAVFIETNWMTRGGELPEFFRFVMVFTVLGSIATLVVRVHQRLWVRATMRDILALQFWLLVTAVATFTVISAAYASVEWSALRLAIMCFVFSCLGVCLPRVVLDLMRDFDLDSRNRGSMGRKGVEPQPAVIIGAGDLGTLFLDHLKSSPHDQYPGLRVLGFVDEMTVLHGRRLRSLRILGGLSMIPFLAQKKGLKVLVIAIHEPKEDLMRKVRVLAERYALKVFYWQVGLRNVSGGEPGAEERPFQIAREKML